MYSWTLSSFISGLCSHLPSVSKSYHLIRSSNVMGISCLTLSNWICFLFYWRELLMIRPNLAIVFWWLHLGSFPACWWQSNVTPIPKGPPSSCIANRWPISITSVMPNVFDRLVCCSSWMIYGTQWCASNHRVCLLEMSGYLWWTFVCVPCTANYIGEWAEGKGCEE